MTSNVNLEGAKLIKILLIFKHPCCQKSRTYHVIHNLKSHYQRCANIRNQFKLPTHLNLANFTNYSDPNFDPRLRDPTLTWDGISWLKTITNLPIIVKGILHPEDAILAVKQGVKGDFFFRTILSYRVSHSKVCKVN